MIKSFPCRRCTTTIIHDGGREGDPPGFSFKWSWGMLWKLTKNPTLSFFNIFLQGYSNTWKLFIIFPHVFFGPPFLSIIFSISRWRRTRKEGGHLGDVGGCPDFPRGGKEVGWNVVSSGWRFWVQWLKSRKYVTDPSSPCREKLLWSFVMFFVEVSKMVFKWLYLFSSRSENKQAANNVSTLQLHVFTNLKNSEICVK